MAEGFEPYHVPQQSRRDKLRVVSQTQQGCAGNHQGCSGLVPIYDPSLISSDFLTCANLHHQSHSVAENCKQSPNPSTVCSGVKEEGANFMGYVGGMISVSPSSSATNYMYMDPQSSVQLNPSSIQDINSNPFLYNHQGLRFLDQSFHGGEVVVYRPEPLSVVHDSNNNSTCGQGLALSLSSHHSQPSSLPLELNLQRYDSSIYSEKMSDGCFVPGIDSGGDASTSNGLSKSSVPLGPFTGYASILKGSRFSRPAQQLLEELCVVGRGTYAEKIAADSVLLDPPLESFGGTGTDYDPRSCSNGGEHRRKNSRLMSMLGEVYKRYKQYYQQMQSVVASFESVAGVRNAAPFANLAFKAMSRHFRCLKNAITDQLQFMTESRSHISCQKDNTALGLENTGVGLQCQRPIQNVGFVENQPVWRPQRGLPERAVTVLRAWLFEHFLHPYPTDTDKLMLAKQTGLSRNQVSNWFINARVRLWKPMVEEIHMLETRQTQKASQKDERNAEWQTEVVPTCKPISCEKTSTSTQRIQDFPSKRTRNDSTANPIGSGSGSGDDIYIPYDHTSQHPRLGVGVGVSSANGSGGVSLTLGLHQNNGIGLPDPFPINAARRFGLDANGEGYVMGGVDATNGQFGREIIGGQILHDFVG